MDTTGKNRPRNVQINPVDQENQNMVWRGSGLEVWVLRSTRVQELLELGDDRCEHRALAIVAGPEAVAVRGMVGGKDG